MIEEWKEIPGYERYQVSTLGRVKSFTRKEPRILAPQIVNKYYAVAVRGEDSKGIWIGVHRLVALTFIPNPDNKPFVCHKDDNPINNKVDNLFWGTPSDNNKDCWDKGRTKGNYKHGKVGTPEYRHEEYLKRKLRKKLVD